MHNCRFPGPRRNVAESLSFEGSPIFDLYHLLALDLTLIFRSKAHTSIVSKNEATHGHQDSHGKSSRAQELDS